MKYNTLWRRFWADIIDAFILLPINELDNFLSAPEFNSKIQVVNAITSFLAFWLYSVLLHVRYGQTIGKMITKVQVLDFSEERILTLKQALVREAAFIIPDSLNLIWFIYLVVTHQYLDKSQLIIANLPIFIMSTSIVPYVFPILDLIVMVSNQKRRTLHDFFAGTVVVRV